MFRAVVPRAVRQARGACSSSRSARRATCERSLRRARGAHRRHPERRRSGLLARARRARRDYALAVGAVEPRKNHSPRSTRLVRWECRSSSRGRRRTRALADELRRGGADVRGYVEPERARGALPRRAACLVQPSRYEGFGLPVLEAMATRHAGRRRPRSRACARWRATRGRSSRPRTSSPTGSAARGRARRLVWAGLERARAFSWRRRRPQRTLEVYREVLERDLAPSSSRTGTRASSSRSLPALAPRWTSWS